MKAKIKRGGGFRGVLNYVFGDEKGAERVAGNMAGADPRDLAKEFSAVRQLRPDIGKPVWHCSLSLPPGEHIDGQKWEAVAADFMQRMGFDLANTPWVAVRHQDTEHDHIHIVASRIALDGQVWLGQWEARRAIEATQALEREHGLTLTPGLGDARAERKGLTSQEVNMAVRTGEEPPRQRLQRILDEAIKDGPSAPELAERLQAAGVTVRANLASTGRMNGFSFEIDGVAFKGSDLGKAYTWAGLQKAGVTYDEIRDRAGLERYRAAVADRGIRPDVAAVGEPDAPRSGEVARGDLGADGPSLGAVGATEARSPADSRGLRSDHGHPTPSLGPDGAGNDREGRAGLRAESPDAGPEPAQLDPERGESEIEYRQPERDGQAHRGPARSTEQGPAEHDAGIGQADRGGQPDAPALVVPAVNADLRRHDRRGHDRDWAKRFKQASAAKRRAKGRQMGADGLEQRDTAGARATESDRVAAREIDPTDYLESVGFTVKREGRHLSVRAGDDEVYRVTQKSDGHWVWCDLYGNHGGDNISLVRELEPGTGYAEAVYRLSGGPTVRPRPRPTEPKREPPKLPTQTQAATERGRAYLKGRGISQETIEHAEKAGLLRYADGGVLFVGLDPSGTAQSATRRATDPADPIQKRDLRGSDKRYPPILPGEPTQVWIVEGGVDALALHDIAKRSGRELPTVIVSGGAGVLGFLDMPHVQGILRKAKGVALARENEKDKETQQRTDAAHQKQFQKISDIVGKTSGCRVIQWAPKTGYKDLAELNLQQQQEVLPNDEAEQLRREEQDRPQQQARAHRSVGSGPRP